MEDDKEQDEISDKIKVFSSDDEKLKMLGELLSNKSSRDIIRLLTDKEMYTNEIANKLDMRANLVIHHLKKLQELGLLEVKNKKIVKKGNEHRHFRMIPNLFITPNHNQEEMKEKETLKKIFKKGIKFMAIGFVTTMTFVLTDLHRFYNPDNISYSSEFPILVIPLTVLSISLIIERIFSIKKGEINPILRI